MITPTKVLISRCVDQRVFWALLRPRSVLSKLLQELLKHEAALDQELALVQRYGVKEL